MLKIVFGNCLILDCYFALTTYECFTSVTLRGGCAVAGTRTGASFSYECLPVLYYNNIRPIRTVKKSAYKPTFFDTFCILRSKYDNALTYMLRGL